jgi:hypothetical protein
MNLQLNSINNYLWCKLFSDRDSLFYDYPSGNDDNRAFAWLPMKAEIEHQFPNPCGWGTGMEDCMLHAGAALDAFSHLEIAGFPVEADCFSKIIRGIERCTFEHGNPGFLVRGLSPLPDAKWYYNTSRDQLTLAVRGLDVFLHKFPDHPAAEIARRILSAIGLYTRKVVRPEHNYDFGRWDGGAAMVSRLWNCDCHEMLRLPMIYTAAFHATGEQEFFDDAMAMLEYGIERTMQFDNLDQWWNITASQLALSVMVLEDSHLFPEFADKFRIIREFTAGFARQKLIEKMDFCDNWNGNWYARVGNWRHQPMKIREESLLHDGCAVFDRYTYLLPPSREPFRTVNNTLRAVGNYMVAASGSSEPYPAGLPLRIEMFLNGLDWERLNCGAPISILHGLSLNINNLALKPEREVNYEA